MFRPLSVACLSVSSLLGNIALLGAEELTEVDTHGNNLPESRSINLNNGGRDQIVETDKQGNDVLSLKNGRRNPRSRKSIPSFTPSGYDILPWVSPGQREEQWGSYRAETDGKSQSSDMGQELPDVERIDSVRGLGREPLPNFTPNGYEIVPWVPPDQSDGQIWRNGPDSGGILRSGKHNAAQEMVDGGDVGPIDGLGLEPLPNFTPRGDEIVPWVPPDQREDRIGSNGLETAGNLRPINSDTGQEMTASERVRFIEELNIGTSEPNQESDEEQQQNSVSENQIWSSETKNGPDGEVDSDTGKSDIVVAQEQPAEVDLQKIDIASLLQDGVDIDALYDAVKSNPDTVIDESEGTMIFRENGEMFEIFGVNELENEETTTEMSTANPEENQTFVITNDTKHDPTSTKFPAIQPAPPKLLLSSPRGSPTFPKKEPYKPMTSHGLLGPRKPLRGLLMASGTSSARDPTCPPANGTRDTVVADGFYKRVTDDRVEILATSVFLDANSAIYNPCKDFYLQAVSVTVKGTIKWKGRNVYITAVNLTVAGEKATIDASFQSPGQPDNKLPADDGISPGENGRDGGQGGKGNQGGDVKMYVAFLFGGQLEVKSQGGPGGRGQDGGNGREGAAGSPNTDYDACCRGRSTHGGKGGRGGNAGKPGRSGDGGRGGDVTFLTLNQTWEDMDMNLLTSVDLPLLNVDGGQPGQQAKPGRPGVGGPGGMGSKTRCKSHGILWWKKKKCEGNNGAYGPQGDTGSKAPSAPMANRGSRGNFEMRSIDFDEFSKYVSTEMVQVTIREGNKYYKNGEFTSARDVYLWVYYTGRYSSDLELQQYANQSLLYLRQLSHGLDFWAHAPNSMPLSSYNSIYSYLSNDIVPYARHVEVDYNLYFAKSTEIQRRQAIIQDCMGHTRYNMDVLDKTREDKMEELNQIKSELSELIHLQRESRVSAEGISANCKNAVDIYLVKQRSKMIFRDILNIIGAAVKIFTLATGGFQSLSGGFGEFVGALDSVKGLQGKGLFDQIVGVGTIIEDVRGIFDKSVGTIVTTIGGIEEQYEKIKDTIEKRGQENSVKIVADGKELQKLLEQYLFLPECRDAQSRIQSYMDLSQSVNDKILHHDSVVLRISTLDAQYGVLQLEESRLRGEMGKGFDPTVIEYAITISRIYTNLKDAIVDKMKLLQEAYNYQFLENRVFKFDDSRIALLEAWLANNRIHMVDKIEQLGSQAQIFNQDSPPMVNSIVISRDEFPDDFAELDRTGDMAFTVTGKEDQLAPLTNVRMLDVRVWLPGVKTGDDNLRVWLKRYGSSTVYDKNGEPWTFTHAPRTMLFDYNVKDLTLYSGRKSSSKQVNIYVENTRISVDETSDYVALSPIGPWALSVSPKYNPDVDTRKVKAIYLQMTYSFLPCAVPVCPPRSYPFNYSADSLDGPGGFDEPDGPYNPNVPDVPNDVKFDEQTSTGNHLSVTALAGIIVAGVLVVVMLVAIGTISYRRRHRGGEYDNVSMTWDYSDSRSPPSERSPLTTADPWEDNERVNSNAAAANA